MLQEITDSDLEQVTVPVLYRPFDVRWIFYHDSLVWRTVKRVMHHMLAGKNLALIVPRRVEHVGSWQHAFVCELISEHVAVSLKTIDYHFPLYLYPDKERRGLFASLESSLPRPNLNPKLLETLREANMQEPTPEEIFHYIYAVLYAPAYREKYADFLRRDFPRVPLTADVRVFHDLAALGERLVGLHLLKSPDLDLPAARFQGQGDDRVARSESQGFHYVADELRVYINKSQFFAPVTPEVWVYQIGGYQVCEKWLKDRKERRLDLEEIRTYCRIITAIKHTIEIQEEIDALYPQVEANLLPESSQDSG